MPAEYVEDFHAALKEEVGFGLRAVEGHRANEAEEDVGASLGLVAEKIQLAAMVKANARDDPREPLVLPADDHLGDLAHACETMAVRIIAPKLQRELKPCPVDEGQVIVIRALLSRMAWALDRAAELSAERKRRA